MSYTGFFFNISVIEMVTDYASESDSVCIACGRDNRKKEDITYLNLMFKYLVSDNR